MAWQIAAAFQVAGGLYSARAKRKAAREARRQATAEAAALRAEKFEVAALATEQHADRMEQFTDLVATNEALAAFMGRSGRSIQALQKREQRKYGKDVDRIRQQEARQKESLESQARAALASGRVKSQAYKSAATASLLTTFGKAATLAGPSSQKTNFGGSSGASSSTPKTGMKPPSEVLS